LLQQMVATALLDRFPQLTSDDVRSTPMGVRGVDVQLSARARQLVPYAFECKACEKLNVWAAWEQCQSHLREGDIPLLVARRNRTEPIAILPWNHLLDLLAPPASGDVAEARVEVRESLQRALAALDRLK
jgi:hypothetical protein